MIAANWAGRPIVALYESLINYFRSDSWVISTLYSPNRRRLADWVDGRVTLRAAISLASLSTSKVAFGFGVEKTRDRWGD